MVEQYPHFLFVRGTNESTQGTDGTWTTTGDAWVFHSVCREEPNGKGSVINGQDGKAIVFASTVYMPQGAARIKEGTEVLVSETNSAAGFARVKGQVLRFAPGQLNCRLWV